METNTNNFDPTSPNVDPYLDERELAVGDVTQSIALSQRTECSLDREYPSLAERDWDGNQSLVGAVEVGDRTLGVVRVTVEGRERTGVVDIRQRTPQYNVDKRTYLPRFLGWVPEDGTPFTIGRSSFPEGHGSDMPEQACTVSLNADKVTIGNPSEQQVNLLVSNGGSGSKHVFGHMPWAVRGKDLEEGFAKSPESNGYLPEFNVGDVQYKVLGRDPGARKGLVMETVDPRDGRRRTFMVYHSQSEGGERVTQGSAYYTEGGESYSHYLKGPEARAESQYTQDTQLHPDFINQLEKVFDTKRQEDAVPPTDLMQHVYSEQEGDALIQDFADQVRTVPLKTELDGYLHALKAGALSTEDISRLVGSRSEHAREAGLRRYIDNLNYALEASGVLPDFTSEPLGRKWGSHPSLGTFITNIYQSHVNGRTVEWHVAQAEGGQVWIDRIRDADSMPTVYGTDDTMLYSGALTSKPYEYSDQVTGLPAEWRRDVNGSYTDISEFLNQLAPIKHFRAGRAAYEAANPNRARMYYPDRYGIYRSF